MKYTNELKNYFNNLKDTLDLLNLEDIQKFIEKILEARERGNNIFIFGNGGSAATATHIAGDFLKGVSYGLDKRFKFISLNDNISAITAISNDLSYEEIFYESLKTYLQKGDIVIGISGSGNSVNVIKAIELAKGNGNFTIGFCGFKGGKLKEIVDLPIHVPINDMEITEDIHIIIFHAIKQILNKELKGDNYSMGINYDKRVSE